MQIGDYECQTPFATVGSGSARWCVAQRAGKRWFLKQFLSPVRPSALSRAPSALRHSRIERCETFERRKTALYDALRCTLGDCVVPVADFFLFEGRYYAVSEYVDAPSRTLDTRIEAEPDRARSRAYLLARCLKRLHAQGIVHADLKPEHILLSPEGETERLRLIDFDSGFFEDDPPTEPHAIEGDPVYLSPEAYLCLSGAPRPLTRRLDTFAFALIVHRLWTGELPRSGGGCIYPYESVLEGEPMEVSDVIPVPVRRLIERSLAADPAARPDDGLWERILAPRLAPPRGSAAVENGLSRYLLTPSAFPPDGMNNRRDGKE